jgi:hypothetical protein
VGGDDEFPLASLFTKRDISLLGVSNLFFSIAFGKSAFFHDFGNYTAAIWAAGTKTILVKKNRGAVVVDAVVLA